LLPITSEAAAATVAAGKPGKGKLLAVDAINKRGSINKTAINYTE